MILMTTERRRRKKNKDKDSDSDDSDDDDDGGGLLIPIIELVAGLFPRIPKSSPN